MGLGSFLMDYIAKRMAAFFGHICRGSSGDDFVTIVEGCIEGIWSGSAQRQKWTDDTKDWVVINEYGRL